MLTTVQLHDAAYVNTLKISKACEKYRDFSETVHKYRLNAKLSQAPSGGVLGV